MDGYVTVKPGVNLDVNLGVLAALGAAVLFGAGTPLAKWLLAETNPWMLAGLFYV